METKELSTGFLDLSIEEMEFIKNVRETLKSIINDDFEIFKIHVGIGVFVVEIYKYPHNFSFTMDKNHIVISNENGLKIKIDNEEIYNKIVDKLNEKKEHNVYVSVEILTLEKH